MKLHSVVRRAAMLASDLIHIHFSPSLLRSISPSSRTKGPGTASSPGKKAQTWKLVLSGECHEIWWPNLLCSNDFSIQNLVQTWHHTLCSLFHWIRFSSGFFGIVPWKHPHRCNLPEMTKKKSGTPYLCNTKMPVPTKCHSKVRESNWLGVAMICAVYIYSIHLCLTSLNAARQHSLVHNLLFLAEAPSQDLVRHQHPTWHRSRGSDGFFLRINWAEKIGPKTDTNITRKSDLYGCFRK